MKFTDWFDPHNLEHMRAYSILVNTGQWPENFIPKDVELNVNWNIHIQYKLADAWMEHILSQIRK